MPDEYVTTKQFTALERRMDEGFAEIKALIADLKHAVELERRDDHAKYDDRYLLREESLQDSIIKLNNPEFRKACYPIVAEYICTDDGREKIGNMVSAYMAKTRDSVTKWIEFLKAIIGIIIVISVVYGWTTVIKAQESIRSKQEVLSNQIEQLN